jgi:hypothetical protein
MKRKRERKEGGQKEKKNTLFPPKTRNHAFFFLFD